jgi:PST family polysaccharide transporter
MTHLATQPATSETEESQAVVQAAALRDGVICVYFSLVFQAAVKFSVVVLLTRLLSPADFGLLSVALIFTSVAERFGTVGVGPSVVQREVLTADERRTGEVLSVLSGCCVAGTLWVAAPLIALYFRQDHVAPVLRALALGFCLDGFAVIAEALMQRQLLFRRLMLIDNAAYTLSHAVVGVGLAYAGCGVWALVVANLSLRLIRVVGLQLYLPRGCSTYYSRRGVFRLASARSLLHQGVGFSLGRILNFISLQGDNFVVGRFLGLESLGLYSRAYQLMALPAIYVGQVFDRILFPALAQAQSNRARVERAFLGSLEIVTIVSLPTAVGIFVAADDIVLALFGERWREVVPVLSVLSLGVFFRTAYKCADTLVKSLGAVYEHALRQMIYTIMVVGGSWIGASTMGLVGVAWAVVAAVALHYFVISHLAVRMLRISWGGIARAHVPGAWLALWIAAGLVSIRAVPFVELQLKPISRLGLEVGAAVVIGLLVLLTSNGALRGECTHLILGRICKAIRIRMPRQAEQS